MLSPTRDSVETVQKSKRARRTCNIVFLVCLVLANGGLIGLSLTCEGKTENDECIFILFFMPMCCTFCFCSIALAVMFFGIRRIRQIIKEQPALKESHTMIMVHMGFIVTTQLCYIWMFLNSILVKNVYHSLDVELAITLWFFLEFLTMALMAHMIYKFRVKDEHSSYFKKIQM